MSEVFSYFFSEVFQFHFKKYRKWVMLMLENQDGPHSPPRNSTQLMYTEIIPDLSNFQHGEVSAWFRLSLSLCSNVHSNSRVTKISIHCKDLSSWFFFDNETTISTNYTGGPQFSPLFYLRCSGNSKKLRKFVFYDIFCAVCFRQFLKDYCTNRQQT